MLFPEALIKEQIRFAFNLNKTTKAPCTYESAISKATFYKLPYLYTNIYFPNMSLLRSNVLEVLTSDMCF